MDEESTQLEMTDFAISDAVIDTAEPFVSYAASRGKTLELDIAPAKLNTLQFHGNIAIFVELSVLFPFL